MLVRRRISGVEGRVLYNISLLNPVRTGREYLMCVAGSPGLSRLSESYQRSGSEVGAQKLYPPAHGRGVLC